MQTKELDLISEFLKSNTPADVFIEGLKDEVRHGLYKAKTKYPITTDYALTGAVGAGVGAVQGYMHGRDQANLFGMTGKDRRKFIRRSMRKGATVGAVGAGLFKYGMKKIEPYT